MPPRRRPTPEELALVRVEPSGELPGGGRILPAAYFTGTGTSEHMYAPDVQAAFGCPFHQGTFNLRLHEPTQLQEPKVIRVVGEAWHAVPAIVNEAVLGIHAWKADRHDDTFLEIFSPVKIQEELELRSGMRVTVRLLSGTWL